MASAPGLLFDADVPNGFQYRDDFLSVADEALLAQEIAQLEFSDFEKHGVVARRRVAFFGKSYGASSASSGRTLPFPTFLNPFRDRIAAWAGVEARAFEMALINEYPPGAPIGWHRDAPQYDIVAGMSLLSSCRMKFRPYVFRQPERSVPALGRRVATHEITLERRSAYLLTGESRTAFEHHIPPVSELRYSITFRTLR